MQYSPANYRAVRERRFDDLAAGKHWPTGYVVGSGDDNARRYWIASRLFLDRWGRLAIEDGADIALHADPALAYAAYAQLVTPGIIFGTQHYWLPLAGLPEGDPRGVPGRQVTEPYIESTYERHVANLVMRELDRREWIGVSETAELLRECQLRCSPNTTRRLIRKLGGHIGPTGEAGAAGVAWRVRRHDVDLYRRKVRKPR